MQAATCNLAPASLDMEIDSILVDGDTAGALTSPARLLRCSRTSGRLAPGRCLLTAAADAWQEPGRLRQNTRLNKGGSIPTGRPDS